MGVQNYLIISISQNIADIKITQNRFQNWSGLSKSTINFFWKIGVQNYLIILIGQNIADIKITQNRLQNWSGLSKSTINYFLENRSPKLSHNFNKSEYR
jgi:predicted transcriptional regulator